MSGRLLDLPRCQTFPGATGFRWDDWTMEVKFDGIRCQVVIQRDSVRLFTRTGNEMTAGVPHIAESLMAWARQHGPEQWSILDGEVVYLDPETGAADFDGAGVVTSKSSAARQAASGRWVTLVVFDAPVVLGDDMTCQPIETRRVLVACIADAGFQSVVAMPYGPASSELHAEYLSRYGEGSVLKRRGSVYPTGRRSGDWLKWKATHEADCVVMGFTPGTGMNEGGVGAVVFGQYVDGQMVRRGQCSGMTDAERRDMHEHPERWLGEVIVVQHMGIMKPGFRHPQFRRRRTDKAPTECVWDEPGQEVAA